MARRREPLAAPSGRRPLWRSPRRRTGTGSGEIGCSLCRTSRRPACGPGDSKLQALDYSHVTAEPGGGPGRIDRDLPRVRRVAALLKRWLLGTHKGADKKEHLNYYLDEFTFRFNRQPSRSHGLLSYRLLLQAAVTAPVPFRTMIARASLVASANSVANSTHA